jgi:GT2 family glycosyltransferase
MFGKKKEEEGPGEMDRAPDLSVPDVPVPDVSVIVPTSGRPEAIARLLAALSRQTLPADRFEVIVTDDGTEPPVDPQPLRRSLPFVLEWSWQRRAGPAAARNRAIERARGRFLVILNDDAGPPADLLARHLAAQERSAAPRALLGGFDFAPKCATPFADAITRMGIVFPFDQMRKSGGNPGRFFWTCNLSVPRDAVVAAGGFDESFTKPICEDVELGLRLEKAGILVHWLEGEACLHHHRVDATWLAKRQVELGRGMVQLWRKHGDPELLPWLRQTRGDAELLAAALEREATAAGSAFLALARAIDADVEVGSADCRALETRIREVHEPALAVGLFAGLRGWDSERTWAWLAGLPAATALVVAGGIDDAAKRARLLAGAPVEVVDAEAMRASGRSLRAALAEREGSGAICFLEKGYAGEPDWLARALAESASSGGALSRPGCFRLIARGALGATTTRGEVAPPAALTR